MLVFARMLVKDSDAANSDGVHGSDSSDSYVLDRLVQTWQEEASHRMDIVRWICPLDIDDKFEAYL